MKINQDNYQSYFLDYMEGNLSKSDLDELYAFVYQDPNRIQEFESLDLFILENDNTANFEEKQALKKLNYNSDIIKSENIELFIIAYHENELSVEKKNELERFLNNNKSYITLFEAYKQTILVPETIEFENKEQLKHYAPTKIRPIYYYLSAAASIALIFSMYFLMPNNKKEFAVNKETKPASVVNTERAPQNIPNKTVPDAVLDTEEYIDKPIYTKGSTDKSMDYRKMDSRKTEIVTQKNNNISVELLKTLEAPVSQEYNSTNEKSVVSKPNDNSKTVSEFLVGKVNDYLGTNIPTKKKKIKVWDVAQWGSKAINKVFDKNTEVAYKYDDNGKISSLSLKVGKLAYVKNN